MYRRINPGFLLPFYEAPIYLGQPYWPMTRAESYHAGAGSEFQAPAGHLMPFGLITEGRDAQVDGFGIKVASNPGTQVTLPIASILSTNLIHEGLEYTMHWYDGLADLSLQLSHYCAEKVHIYLSVAEANFAPIIKAVSAPVRLIAPVQDFEYRVTSELPGNYFQWQALRFAMTRRPRFPQALHLDVYEIYYFEGFMDAPAVEREEDLVINPFGEERMLSSTTRIRAQMDMHRTPHAAVATLGRLADYGKVQLWRYYPDSPFDVDDFEGKLMAEDISNAYASISFSQNPDGYQRGRLSWTSERNMQTSCVL